MSTFDSKVNDSKYQKQEKIGNEIYEFKPAAWSTNRYDDVFRLIKDLGGKIIDVGCGAGAFTNALSNYFDDCYGVDISPVVISKNKDSAGNVTFELIDPTAPMPYNDDTFDVLVSINCIAHIPDIFGALNEYRRILKPKGYIVISVPNIAYLKHRITLLVGKLPIVSAIPFEKWEERGWDDCHYHQFTKSILDKTLRSVGFQPKKWTGSGKLSKLRRFYPSLLTGNIVVLAQKI